MNQIMQEELVQSQLVGALADALGRKGVKAQIPDSEEFRLLETEAAELQRKAAVKIQQNLQHQ